MVKRKRNDTVASTSASVIAASSSTLSSAATTRTRRSSVLAQATAPNRPVKPFSSSASNGAAAPSSTARRTPRRSSTMNISYADRDSDYDAETFGNGKIIEQDDSASSDSPISSAPPSDIEEEDVFVEEKKIARTKRTTSAKTTTAKTKKNRSTSKTSPEQKPKRKSKKAGLVKFEDGDDDPYLALEEEEEPLEARPPQVNSDYVPIPWKGRLGYACLNTYLREADPPIFCSRTCRILTIEKHKEENGPDGGLAYVQSLGYANAKDLSKMIEWNERYGIRFLRISSEMFPYASHKTYGYDLDFAAEPLQKAGALAMKYGHRLTMHPGQYTQIASPRKEVVEASVRDLKYHCQVLSGLKLAGQAERDAVMIIHMGGTFGDRAATIARFKKNYMELLNDEIRRRLVLENDDVSWSVEDLLPICQELNIPLVLDWHHHNIVPGAMRWGTLDVMEKYGDIIAKTWTDKGITQKQHISEPCEGAVTNREMIKHSKRIKNFPPCADTMDLMIEAKDKEQAVFELMKKYKLPGAELISDLIPHERQDQNVVPKTPKKPKKKKKASAKAGDEEIEEEEQTRVQLIPEEEISMGGPERRVYYPQGNEHWLAPKKIERKKKAKEEDVKEEDVKEEEANGEETVVATSKVKASKKSRKSNNATEKADIDVIEVPKRKKRLTKSNAAPPPALQLPLPSPSPPPSTEASTVLKKKGRPKFVPQVPITSQGSEDIPPTKRKRGGGRDPLLNF